jgi:alkanesulfonate monooxygenase SsuD/methylene tetrahydromethanopterin reductase-like flavin-dependent oxidoreductase (luciferase family)
MAIRVGLYYDLRNPEAVRPWADVYADTLQRIADAEALGVESIWLTEHHGFADGYLPAPLTFAAAVAARTTTVRIGTAVLLAPLLPLHALAEQAAVVDIISGGRLELGLGAGWRESEFEAFGADFTTRYAALERAAREVETLWSEGRATPPPIQRPLPLWVGARGPRGARIAGRTGAGLLWIDRELQAPYLEGLAAGGYGPGRARVGGLANVFLADDPDAANAVIRPLARHNRRSYSGNNATAVRGESAFPRLHVLTPEAAADHIAELVSGLPASEVFCFGDIGGVGDELVGRHAELVSTVLPKLLARRIPAPPEHA